MPDGDTISRLARALQKRHGMCGRGDFMSGLQPSAVGCAVTLGFALGWDRTRR